MRQELERKSSVVSSSLLSVLWLLPSSVWSNNTEKRLVNACHKKIKTTYLDTVLTVTKNIILYLHFGEHARALRWRSRYDLRLLHLLEARDTFPLWNRPVSCIRSFSQCTCFSLITKHILRQQYYHVTIKQNMSVFTLSLIIWLNTYFLFQMTYLLNNIWL